MEANNTLPELDEEAASSHVLELETVEPALEMESQRQIAELEEGSKYLAELQHIISMKNLLAKSRERNGQAQTMSFASSSLKEFMVATHCC